MSPTFRSLAHPNYRRYVAGSAVSNTGTWMMRIAQDWLVLQLPGGGPGALGLVTGLQFLPVLLFSPYAGLVADRVPKRRLLQITQATMAITSAALALLALSGDAQVWQVYLLAFVFGVGSAFDAPARQAFVSELVSTEDLPNAVGLNSATFNAARLLGPALAGVIIAALGGTAQATGWVMALNALSYLAVIASLRTMDPDLLQPHEPVPAAPGQLREAVAYAAGEPRLVLIGVVAFFAGTFGMNFSITSALMATEVFGRGAGEYGVLGSILAIGSLTGALLAARRTTVRLRHVVLAAIGFGVATMAAGLAPSYVSFALITPLIGVSVMTLLNSANALVQTETDPALRGRVVALYLTIVMGGTPLGAPVIGWLGESFGARSTLLVGGGLTLLGVLLGVAAYGWLRAERTAPRPVRTAPARVPSF